MTTNYEPYDAELLEQDKQNQLKAIYTAANFEGVDLMVNGGRGIGQFSTTIRQMLANLTHKAQEVTRSANHSVSHV